MDSIKNIIENSNEPLVFNEFINDWSILKWSLNDWESRLKDQYFTYRKNYFIKSKSPIWERSCLSEKMYMKDFIKFQKNENNDSWIYFDYKPMSIYFETIHEILEAVQWAKFGFPDKNGKDSTIWIGSKGAHTPCHADTYGYNLIAQVFGRKRWIIFPPEENLKPTRIPFEESSIYSKLNFFYPDINEFKGVSNARSIILNPGDVLYLPPGWWHYVENLETAISVNMWLPLPQDNKKRIEEGIVQLFISQMLKDATENVQTSIINPNNEFILENSVLDYVGLLERGIHIYKNENTQNKKQKLEETTLNKPISTTTITEGNFKRIPKLSQEEFMLLLNEQKIKYNFCEDVKKISTEHNGIFEKLINAVCDPEIISKIADKIVND